MGETTSISWTHRTFNPWMGCERVSPGCDHCYMFRDLVRYGRDPETVVLTKQPWKDVRKWEREQAARLFTPEEMFAKPHRPLPGSLVFTASWSDIFHADADPWRADFWKLVRECPHLIFQVLTKRHGRIAQCLPPDWADGYSNVWLGVTGENREWLDRRLAVLRTIPASVRFVSYEPAIGSIAGADLTGCSWLIVGGESAPGREFDITWAREARELARQYGAALFVKQFGSYPVDGTSLVPDTKMARQIEQEGWAPGPAFRPVRLRLKTRAGTNPDEWPEDLRIREFPSR